ncbi:MAG: PAS domain S-box protein [Nitrospinota bacterium]|nr:PAS domain S-box protein [Nitrospinota bacterium]
MKTKQDSVHITLEAYKNTAYGIPVYFIAAIWVLLMGVLSWAALENIQRQTERDLRESLMTVLTSTHEAINEWVNENRRDMAHLVRDDIFAREAAIFMGQYSSGYTRDRHPSIDVLEQLINDSFGDKSNRRFMLVSADGASIYSLNEGPQVMNKSLAVEDAFLDRVIDGDFAINIAKEWYFTTQRQIRLKDNPNGMFLFGIPVRNQAGTQIGALVMGVELGDDLTRLTMLGKIGDSGETYIFDQDGYLLSESRFNHQLNQIGLTQHGEHSIYNVRLQDPGVNLVEGAHPSMPREKMPLTLMAASAVKGINDANLKGYRDYRGVLVVGAWQWDDELGFGIASEINANEAFKAYYTTRWIVLLVVGAAAALSLLLYLMLLGGGRQAAILAQTALYANELMRREAQMREEAQKELKRSEARLQGMMDNTTSVIYMKDPNGAYLHANKRFLRLFHLRAEEVVGKSDFDIFPKKIAMAFRANDLAVLNSGELLETEETAPTADGERTYISIKFPLYNQDGGLQGICGVSTDITDRKKAEVAAKESERRFRRMLEDVNLVSVMLDDKGNITFVNEFLLELTGYKWEEVIGRNWFDMFIPEDIREQIKGAFAQLISGEGEILKYYENEILTSAGEKRLITWNNTELFDDQGRIVGTASMGNNVTEQRKAVLDLAASERRFHDVAENSGDWIWELDKEGKFIYTSGMVKKILGYRPEEILGRHYWEFCRTAEGRVYRRDFLNPPVDHQHYVNRPNMLVHKNGGFVLAEANAMPVLDPEKGFQGYRGATRDVTERIRAERDLRESQQGLANAQSIAHIGNWDWNIVTNELKWSDEIYRIFGLTPQQFGATYEAFLKYIHPDDRAKVTSAVNKCLNNHEPYLVEHRVLRPDGSIRIVTEQGEVYRDSDGAALRMVGVVADITERKRVEDAMMESEQRLESFMNSAVDIFTLYDAGLNLIEINQAGLKTFGVTREEIIGKNILDLQRNGEAHVLIEKFRRVIQTGEPLEIVQSTERPVLGTRYIQIKAFKAGSGMGIISSDITERKLAEDNLFDKSQHLSNAQKLGNMGSWDLNLVTMRISWSEYVDEIFQFDPSTPSSLEKLWSVIHPEDLDEVRSALDDVLKGASSMNVDHRALRPDGSMIHVNSVGKVMYGPDGKPERMLGVVQNVTDQKKAEAGLQLAAKVYESSLDAIMIIGKDGIINSVNKAFCDITGYDQDDALGKPITLIAAAPAKNKQGNCISAVWKSAQTEGSFRGEIWTMKKSGREFPAWIHINAIKGAHGAVEQYVAIFHDITETKDKEAEIAYQAYYDSLTGLPNRLLFQDRLKMAVARAKRENDTFALMFLDLDNFKNVNDSLGHDVGDLLLKGVSVRLVEALREIDTVARIGGDEFVILLERLQDHSEVLRVARKVIKSMGKSFSFQDKPLYASGSMGITMFPQDGEDTDTLLKNADIAMYKAKEMGKGGFQMFTADMNAKFTTRLIMENNLREAMDKDAFVVHYQPKMNIRTGDITGMEALVRWIRPDGAIVSPADFIPVAEETGLILRIGETVLRKSLRHLSRMNQSLGGRLKLSVNLSARQFSQGNVVEMVSTALRDTGVDPALLELEITESSVMVDVPKAMEKMKELKKLGVKLSIDDFGTGFSSLNYLRQFPIDVLKIDRSFVMSMRNGNADTAIVDSIITIARNLSLTVVAEGVETQKQLSILRGLGCDEAQGYLISQPVAESNILEVIGKHSMMKVSV